MNRIPQSNITCTKCGGRITEFRETFEQGLRTVTPIRVEFVALPCGCVTGVSEVHQPTSHGAEVS